MLRSYVSFYVDLFSRARERGEKGKDDVSATLRKIVGPIDRKCRDLYTRLSPSVRRTRDLLFARSSLAREEKPASVAEWRASAGIFPGGLLRSIDFYFRFIRRRAMCRNTASSRSTMPPNPLAIDSIDPCRLSVRIANRTAKKKKEKEDRWNETSSSCPDALKARD